MGNPQTGVVPTHPGLAVIGATGQITANGTAAALGAAARFNRGLRITNTSSSITVFWGASGVLATTGDAIMPGQSVKVPIADPSTVFVITATSSAVVTYSALKLET